jgi:hypothetical protein
LIQDGSINTKKTKFFLLKICFVINSIPQPVNSTADIISVIQGNIKWYLILGAGSILCYFIGYSLWV